MSSPERAPSPAVADLTARAEALAKDVDGQVNSGDLGALAPAAIQALIAAACRAYAAKLEAGEAFPILSQKEAVTGTDVMIVCSALLKAADLQVFELGMWSSWTGR